MSETDKGFAGSIPEDYDRYLVPLIFEAFARDIAQRAAEVSPRSVLETAAGAAWSPSPGAGLRRTQTTSSPTSTSRCLTMPPPNRLPTVASAGAKRTTGTPVRRCRLRSRVLPVRRHVLPRPPEGLPGGKEGTQDRRMFLVQRLGPHRAERLRERCHERARRSLPERPPRLYDARRTAITTRR